MNFVFQKSFSDKMDEEGEELRNLCKEFGINFYPITVRPFEHTVVEEDTISDLKGFTVVHGSNVMEDVVKTYGWNPGIFEVKHDEISSDKAFGTDYINHDMIICNTDNYLESLKENNIHNIEFYFMKPNLQKFFPGTIVDKKMMPFVIESQGRNFGSPDVYDLCIAPIKYIEAEWRFFVVQGKIADGSKYHAAEFKLDVREGFKKEAGIFAEQMIEKFDPAGTFVIDIAEMKNGEYKVVEINCLNSSGFYKIDKRKLLFALDGLYENKKETLI
jgi:hypothetical protein